MNMNSNYESALKSAITMALQESENARFCAAVLHDAPIVWGSLTDLILNNNNIQDNIPQDDIIDIIHSLSKGHGIIDNYFIYNADTRTFDNIDLTNEGLPGGIFGGTDIGEEIAYYVIDTPQLLNNMTKRDLHEFCASLLDNYCYDIDSSMNIDFNLLAQIVEELCEYGNMHGYSSFVTQPQAVIPILDKALQNNSN